MDAFDWKIFLQDFSRELLADDEIPLFVGQDCVEPLKRLSFDPALFLGGL